MVAGFCHSLPPAARSTWGILKRVCVCASCVTKSTVRLNKGLAYGAEGQVQGFACRSALHTIGDHSARVWFTHVYTSPKRGWCRVLGELLNGEETKVYWSPLPPVPYTHSLRLLGVSVYLIIYCSMLSKEPSGNTRGHQSVQFPRVQYGFPSGKTWNSKTGFLAFPFP